MRQKSGPEKQPAEDAIRDIRRATRRHFSAEEKIRVVLEGLRGEESIAELCRRGPDSAFCRNLHRQRESTIGIRDCDAMGRHRRASGSMTLRVRRAHSRWLN